MSPVRAGTAATRERAATGGAARGGQGQWAESFGRDAIDLRGFPKGIVRKARHVLQRIQAGDSIAELGGKRMHYDRHVLSIPVGSGYRMICEDQDNRIIPKQLLTHEDYNNIHP